MSESRPDTKLYIAPCSRKLAAESCVRWHYSKRAPAGKLWSFGVSEAGRHVGAVIFGNGAAPRIGEPFGLPQTAMCELVRVALRDHIAPVTRMVAVALRQLRRMQPQLRLVVSFADPMQSHHGGIYQAGNWIYLGADENRSNDWTTIDGKLAHPRSLVAKYGTRSIAWVRENLDPSAAIARVPSKHKYVYPLDAAMRVQLAPLARPYPKRVGSIDSDVTANHAGEGGASPTPTLYWTPAKPDAQAGLFDDGEAA